MRQLSHILILGVPRRFLFKKKIENLHFKKLKTIVFIFA